MGKLVQGMWEGLGLGFRLGGRCYRSENFLERAGILMEERSGTGKKKKTQPVTREEGESTGKEDLKTMSLEDLNTLLNDVLESEDYVRAIAIRDEINNRKKNR